VGAGAIGGVPDAVRDGETGVLVDGTDAASVTSAVGDLLADAQWRRAMGDAGAKWCAEQFGWPRRTAELREILTGVVESGVRTP
jgi:phosphatidylinositol alpha-1,6-mannosyltransferase